MRLSHLFFIFAKIGLLSFGGPAAQISLMHRVLVDEQRCLTEQQYLNALGFCMLLPGPEAMQLATYAGWKIRGIPGGLIAGLLFVIPGAIVIFALASAYMLLADLSIIDTLFVGVKACVLIIVFEAMLKVSKRALKQRTHYLLAAASFIGIFFLSLPFPIIIFAAALFGFFTSKHNSEQTLPPSLKHNSQVKAKTALIIGCGLSLWILPILLIELLTEHNLLTQIAVFFSKLAVVTFGGAYAVLAYMAQDVVNQYQWLDAAQMMDGLGLAETTPGPLILVTEFVGFIAGFNQGGFWMAAAAALITLWVTFVPCFIWIFVGAPYIDWIHSQQKLSNALQMIIAAVVGVILNLALWFALHVIFNQVSTVKKGVFTLYAPQLDSINWQVILLSSISALLLLRFRIGVVKVLFVTAICAWALAYLS
jgi:chromate transporter